MGAHLIQETQFPQIVLHQIFTWKSYGSQMYSLYEKEKNLSKSFPNAVVDFSVIFFEHGVCQGHKFNP